MKPMVATNDYLIACLWKDGKQKKVCIHRLVANAFIPNPMGLPEINHIDEDKKNNNVLNLEWCSHKYNMSYGNVRNKMSNAAKGRHISIETLNRLSLNSKNRKWINNNIEEKFIKVDDYAKYDSSWKFGRLKRR